jgi:hypothetical protein
MTGRMKHIAGKLLAGGVTACGLAFALRTYGWIPLWAFAAIVVLAFPPAVLALFLWWMADEGEGDIPFIGY